jgi:Na+/melibiose symporter-like transporter
VRRVLAIRDIRVYLAGQGLSMLGDSALWLAMGIWVKQLTGSSAAAGLTWLAFMAPALAGPAVGLLADRVRRRELLLVVNLASAAIVAPLLLVRDAGDVWVIYAVMFVYGISNALTGAAQPALLRTIVPDALLPDANGVLQTMHEGLRLVAPLAGAGLFAVTGPAAVVGLDAASFLAAAAALAAMRVREPRPAPPARHPVADALEGVRHIWSTPLLRRLLVACVIAVVAFGFSETAVFAIVDSGLHRGPAFVGVIMAVQGVAAVIAGIVAAAMVRRVGEPRLFVLGLVVFAAGCPLMASGRLAPTLAGVALLGWGIPWTMVGLNTLVMRLTPLTMQGRVSGAAEMLVAIPQLGSIAAGAAVVAALGFRVELAAMAVLLLAATIPLIGDISYISRPQDEDHGTLVVPEGA